MTWVATAIGVSAVVGAGAQAYSANKASKAMGNAADQSAAVQERIYQDQVRRNQPFEDVGVSALNAYAQAMGLPQAEAPSGPNSFEGYGRYDLPMEGTMTAHEVVRGFEEYAGRRPTPFELDYYTSKKAERNRAKEFYHNFARSKLEREQQQQQQQQEFQGGSKTNPDDRYGGFEASPGYQFRLDEGARGLDRNMAARGLLNSGARGKAMTRYNQGQASNEFGSYMNRLAGAAGIGQTAAQNTNAMAGSYGNNMANNAMNAGMARASGYLGAGNAIGSTMNNVMAALPYMRNRPGGRPPPAINPSVTY